MSTMPNKGEQDEHSEVTDLEIGEFHGDYFVRLPDEMLNRMGWKLGDDSIKGNIRTLLKQEIDKYFYISGIEPGKETLRRMSLILNNQTEVIYDFIKDRNEKIQTP